MLTSFEAAAEHLVHGLSGLRKRAPEAVVVAVGGPTAVGKSRLARLFQDTLKSHGECACILEGDRFLLPQARRAQTAGFPDGIYEVARVLAAVKALRAGRMFKAPFYERMGRTTGRATVSLPDLSLPEEVREFCTRNRAASSSRLVVDRATGDVEEEIHPGRKVWIFDSELALLYPALKALYDVSYGIRASREVRRRHFLEAVERGERYATLSREEAAAKIEGFFDTDDRLIEPTVDDADYVVVLNG
ncbi:MAG: hypothetical protein O2954_20045 [bacterium]|nr:hypothetical protein [bacterium]